MFCSKCGFENKEGIKFCAGCGTNINETPSVPAFVRQQEATVSPTRMKMADEIHCFSCGSIIKKEAEICKTCGVRQKKENQAIGDGSIKALIAVASFATMNFIFILPQIPQILRREYSFNLQNILTFLLLLSFNVTGMIGFIRIKKNILPIISYTAAICLGLSCVVGILRMFFW